MSPRVDPAATRALAEELDAVVAAVPGVLRVQPRLGIGRFARRVVEGLAAMRPGGSEASAGASGPSGPSGLEPRVSLTISDAETLVELDVVVAHDHSGPVVVRAVAAAILERLALTVLPAPRVDVRIVSVG